MAEDVDWPNMLARTRIVGKEAVRTYWADQFRQIDPQVAPISVTELGDGQVVVEVHQVIRTLDGAVLSDGRVRHVYRFKNGLIARLDVEAVL